MHDGNKLSCNLKCAKRTLTSSLACMVGMQYHGMSCSFRSIVKYPRKFDTTWSRQQQQTGGWKSKLFKGSCMRFLYAGLDRTACFKYHEQSCGSDDGIFKYE